MSVLRVVLVAASLLMAPAVAVAELDMRTTPPTGLQSTTATLAEVLALNAKGHGKRLDSFATRIEEWSSRVGGFETTTRTLWSGRDFKSIEHRGPFVTQSGRVGAMRWEQNINGITVIMGGVHPEADDFEQAMSAARAGVAGGAVKLLGEVGSPVAAYVIEVRPAGDPPTWLFIDRSNGLLIRDESVYDRIRTTTTYRDFRTISGAVVAGTVLEMDGDPTNDRTSTLTSLRTNVPIRAVELDVPQTRDLVQFPAGATSVQLPVTMPNNSNRPILRDRDYEAPSGSYKSHIVVRVVIKGRGLDFALDSGASGILIDKDVATQLGLARYGRNGQTLEGEAGASRVVIPEMHVGDLVMKNIAAYDLPFGMRTTDTEEVVGLLGFDFIASVGLKVDWDKGQVIAYPPGTIRTPETSFTLPLRLDDLVPDISVTIGDVASDRFILDTGAGGAIIPLLRAGEFLPVLAGGVLIFPEFAAAHQVELQDQGLGRETQIILPGLYLSVVGGVAKAYPVQAKRVVFGVPFAEFIVLVIDPKSHWGSQDMDGLVGYAFLRYFNLYFDYQSSRILLEPNEQYKRAKKIPDR